MHVQKTQACQGMKIFRGEFTKKYNPQLYFCMPHFWNKINRRTNIYKVDENSKKIGQKDGNVLVYQYLMQYCYLNDMNHLISMDYVYNQVFVLDMCT